MRFVFAIQVISMLLMFKFAASQNCDIADWGVSLDRKTWSVCPKTNTYLRGFWRSDKLQGDERVGRLEQGRCCEAEESSYANEPATCLNAKNWKSTLNGFNVWALCPAGYYLNGLRLGRGPPAFLSDIDEGQCCHPQNHPDSYEECYDEDVIISFDRKGWSECQRAGYYMTGFYKSNCNQLFCIEKFRCCKMKKGVLNAVDGGWSDFGDWSECSESCGGGIKKRRRTCTNPPPTNGGHFCVGNNMEAQTCNPDSCEEKKVDGNFTEWGAWGACSQSCENGTQVRVRNCTNPPPAYGGLDCIGEKNQSRECYAPPCPASCSQKTTPKGQCCSIPFTYKGVTYHSCTRVDWNRPWCSLDSTYKGRWGNCTSCSQKTTPKGQCCTIPFTYKGVAYHSCTRVDWNRPWCSLDSTYKGRWGNCAATSGGYY